MLSNRKFDVKNGSIWLHFNKVLCNFLYKKKHKVLYRRKTVLIFSNNGDTRSECSSTSLTENYRSVSGQGTEFVSFCEKWKSREK